MNVKQQIKPYVILYHPPKTHTSCYPGDHLEGGSRLLCSWGRGICVGTRDYHGNVISGKGTGMSLL